MKTEVEYQLSQQKKKPTNQKKPHKQTTKNPSGNTVKHIKTQYC